jgi:hypothetical protein
LRAAPTLSLGVAILILAVTPNKANAYTSIGQGTLSCGIWTAWRRTSGALGPEQWVLGFLSGIGAAGRAGDDPLDGMDAEGVWAWIDIYCSIHPLISCRMRQRHSTARIHTDESGDPTAARSPGRGRGGSAQGGE